jgi:hypothetical protein
MAPMKERVEKEGGKKKEMTTVEVKNVSASRATAEVMGISSEEEEKKTEPSLSSHEIKQEAKASVIG